MKIDSNPEIDRDFFQSNQKQSQQQSIVDREDETINT